VEADMEGWLAALPLRLTLLLSLPQLKIISSSPIAAASVFTTSPPILKLILECAPFLAISLAIHPFIMIMEGTIIAKRDTGYLLLSYGATFATLMASLRKATCLKEVWAGFLFFQAIRLIQFGVRVALRRKTIVEYSS
jgi:hypothetical protein